MMDFVRVYRRDEDGEEESKWMKMKTEKGREMKEEKTGCDVVFRRSGSE